MLILFCWVISICVVMDVRCFVFVIGGCCFIVGIVALLLVTVWVINSVGMVASY